ncbi:MAG: ABC transporter substrate-binding protein [Clostridia bacterium]|nr:ABC transporter substrate-binding protein [Clostridia bacterium]
MKKIISILLVFATVVLLAVSCGPVDTTAIKIGVLNGPTGMGMAQLIDENKDNEDKYIFTNYASPDLAIPLLMKGELDMLCLPTNVAALQAEKLDVSVIAINCLGSLYLLTDSKTTVSSIEDLDGKTIYTSVANSTTVPILNYIFDSVDIDVKIEVMADHPALAAAVANNEVSIAVLPEPMASTAITNAQAKGNTYTIDLNISQEWDKVSDTPLAMGCIVVKNSFLAEHKSVVDSFLNDYKDSIEYINNKDNFESAVDMIVKAGITPKEALAKSALANLYGSIVYIDGDDMKTTLVGFYNAIGQALPKDDFYYEK